MTDFVLLDPEQHRDLKVITERAASYGDSVQYAMTFPFEFRNVQNTYPIFFQKDPSSGRLFPLALFGFQEGENLFLNDSGWDARYVPIMIRRQPFLIGFQSDPENVEKKRAMVSIDMDNPRVNNSRGEALFHEHGGMTDFLQEVSGNLELIHQAHEHCTKFVATLVEYDLIESFSMEITLDDGSTNQLLGFYAINEESVRQLGGTALGSLNEQGFLQPLFMILASLSSVSHLIDRKNATLPDIG